MNFKIVLEKKLVFPQNFCQKRDCIILLTEHVIHWFLRTDIIHGAFNNENIMVVSIIYIYNRNIYIYIYIYRERERERAYQ